MTVNKSQMNGDKTEAMLVGTKHKLSALSITSLQLDENSVTLTDSAKNLHVVLDNTLDTKLHQQNCSILLLSAPPHQFHTEIFIH